MKILVFLPADDALEAFPFGEFEFDAMPLEGQILRFNDFEDADYPVEQVGFIQEGTAFVAAVWAGPPRPRRGLLSATARSDELSGEAAPETT